MTSYRSKGRRAVLAPAAVCAALVLAGCGSQDSGSAGHSAHDGVSPAAAAPSAAPSAVSAHNAADVSFARDMIPHHRQAVEMADLAATRASSAEVRKLASEVRKAQAPEIRTLSGWLTAWGEPAPARDAADHSGHTMPGMMGDGDMSALEKSSGAAFDTAFLKLMTEHHEGAVAMARTEVAEGAHRGAKDMAESVISSQTAEITRMRTLVRG
ncbi:MULTISPECIES: DUF305 domain-containing protein [unclassified Streptomyces]|uniref:DUF305 domain-containing protein n=1 Tax=unclassified Streptomyces TaxID=2593676 RepID=UPI002E2D03EC|nr:DUF305 domain-containing protein [Streptomyces sp. NBC_01429]